MRYLHHTPCLHPVHGAVGVQAIQAARGSLAHLAGPEATLPVDGPVVEAGVGAIGLRIGDEAQLLGLRIPEGEASTGGGDRTAVYTAVNRRCWAPSPS